MRRRCKRHAGKDPAGRLARGTHGAHTLNIKLMSVTLDVSKLSGWLNLSIVCRVEKRAYDAGRPPWDGRWQGGGLHSDDDMSQAAGRESGVQWLATTTAQVACRLETESRARAEHTWNIPLMSLTRDVLKLSVWSNLVAPCRVERRAYDEKGEVRGGWRRRRRKQFAELETVESTGHALSTP